MNELIEKIFVNEITEQGLVQLQKDYPTNLVIDMSVDANFKAARKTRTECNKLVKAIKDRRIGITTELKEYGDSITDQINGIYAVVVDPFEAENEARKVAAAKEAKELEELLAGQRFNIKAITGFVTTARDKDSKGIQGVIEAVDLIDVEDFHKDLIHEAIETKKDAIAALGQLLTDTISRENMEIERENLRVKQAEADKAKILEDKIMKLRMTPGEYFDKTSVEIETKIEALSEYAILPQVFGDRCAEVETSKATVITQLSQLLVSVKMMEDADAIREAELDKIDILSPVAVEETVDDVPIEDHADEEWVAPEETAGCILSEDLAEWANRWEVETVATEELDAILAFYSIEVDMVAQGEL